MQPEQDLIAIGSGGNYAQAAATALLNNTELSAKEIAEKAPNGSVILCMLPDTAERYMSSPLFESIESEMDTEELNISKSTPGFQIPEQ